MTTWRLESMWTRTLSTTISTSPSSMSGLSHTGPGRRARRGRGPPPPGPDGDDDLGQQRPDDEPADMGEERDATRLDDAERCQPVDALEDEPESEDEDRRHVDQLIEEAQEHERGHACPREEHEVRAER